MDKSICRRICIFDKTPAEDVTRLQSKLEKVLVRLRACRFKQFHSTAPLGEVMERLLSGGLVFIGAAPSGVAARRPDEWSNQWAQQTRLHTGRRRNKLLINTLWSSTSQSETDSSELSAAHPPDHPNPPAPPCSAAGNQGVASTGALLFCFVFGFICRHCFFEKKIKPGLTSRPSSVDLNLS